MKKIFIYLGGLLFSLLLRLRYRITYKGLREIEEALKNSKNGCLFLPNHPAVVIDPLIVSLPLVRLFHVRPLIVEYMYYNPMFHRLAHALRALAIPDFATGFNPLKLKRAERMLNDISDGVKRGERFLIYPAGHTRSISKEVVGGSFGVYQLILENPDVDVVLVRTTGLWGSSFSRALTFGQKPDVNAALQTGFWTCLKNLLFFVPKRDVLVEFELARSELPRNTTKNEFNRYLEYWYNKPFGPEGEPLKLVSYSCWKEQLPVIQGRGTETPDLSDVPQDVQERILSELSEITKLSPPQILPNLRLVENLGLDSLDLAELVSFLELHYNAVGITPEDLVTVGSLFLIASGANKKKALREPGQDISGWNKDKPKRRLVLPEGKTLPEVFLKRCDGHLFDTACADHSRGSLSYYQMKLGAMILCDLIKKMKGDRIGILLPASNPAQVLILAIQMAGKTPVLFNWTVDGEYLDAMINVTGIEVILSSWIFLDSFEHVDLSILESKIVVLEEVKIGVKITEFLKNAFLAFMPSSYLLKRFSSKKSEAVVLFTSGTETMPKSVPLSHENILFDMRACLNAVELYESDRLLSALPPFNAFGFGITGLLPLLCGLRVVYYPNPTDYRHLAAAITEWNITVICSSPSLIKNIFLSSPEDKFSSLRMVISGGAKPRDEFFSLLYKCAIQAKFVEGYGVSECASVVCVNSTGDRKKGVGKPLEGIKLMVVNPKDLHEPRAKNEVGLILIAGPTLFSGYLNKEAHSPFIDIEDTRWYQTGDLGKLDEEGNLIFVGRLNRFCLVGKAMVSLRALEEVLLSQSAFSQERYAVMAESDHSHKVRLVLFTNYPIKSAVVNQILHKNGFSHSVKIDRVIQLESIPLTVTGRVSYRQLEKMLHSEYTGL